MKKRFISLLLQLAIFASLQISANADSSFNDISGKWYEQTVLHAVEKGWANGYPDGSFKGDSTITTAEFISMVVKVFELKSLNANTELPFKDVYADNWFYNDIVTAYDNNLIPYTDFHVFNNSYKCSICKNSKDELKDLTPEYLVPDGEIYRINAAIILSRLPGLPDVGRSVIIPHDFNSMLAYEQQAVEKLYTLRILIGDENLNINPYTYMTRGEAITLIERTYNTINDLLPEFIEPQFAFKEKLPFGTHYLYITNPLDMYNYIFETNFVDNRLNHFTYFNWFLDEFRPIDLENEPESHIISEPTTNPLYEISSADIWNFYEPHRYDGYIPSIGESVTLKTVVTNRRNNIKKVYFNTFVVE